MALWNIFKKEEAPKRRREPTIGKKRSFYNAHAAAEINNLTSSWAKESVPINEHIFRDLKTLRARSRDLAKNDVHVKKFLRVIKSNVIGRSGIKLQSKVLNSNGTIDDAAVLAIETAWKDFGDWGVANVKNSMTFVEMQNMFWEQLLRDGEVIVLKVFSDTVNRFGFGLQFIDPEALEIQNNRELKNGNKIRMGVEINPTGVPVAYHFSSTDTTHDTYYKFNNRGYIRISANRIMHRFFSEYADQVRGIPEIAVAMTRIKNLDGYEQAEIISKRVSASKMGFFSRNEDGEGYEGEENEDGTISMDASPGVIEEVGSNVNFMQFDPTHDGGSYEAFVRMFKHSIATGLGISNHSLTGDMAGVNFSTARIALIEDRDFFMAFQDWFISCFYKPVFHHWLESSLIRGQLTIPTGGTLRLSDLPRYKNATFQGRRWLWVDPLKDMTANEKAVALGLTSRRALIAEQGKDPDEVFAEIAEENRKLKELGILQEPAIEAGFLMPEEGEEDDQ